MTRYRHVNREATRDRLIVTLQRRASTSEKVVWQTDRPIPAVSRP